MRESQRSTTQHAIRLPDVWQVPQGILDRLGTDLVGRQRAIVDETLPHGIHSPLLLVLHEVPDRTPQRQGLFFWRDLDGLWRVYRQGEAYDSQADGMAALDEHFANYEAEEHALRQEYERARRAGQYLTILEEAALKVHAAANLHRTLTEARALMREQKIPQDVEIINARDRAYNIEREFDLLYTDTQNALDYREAHAVEVLNILFLIFFPLTIIATIFETGIVQQILDTNPTLDPLILTIALLFAALLIGVGLYLLISPRQRKPRRTRRRGQVRATAQRTAVRADAQPRQTEPVRPAQSRKADTASTVRAVPPRANPLLRNPTGKPLVLDKQMARYELKK